MEISVSPPETLVKFDAPLFGGIEPSKDTKLPSKTQNQESNSKLEDMVNSMLPPRFIRKIFLFCFVCLLVFVLSFKESGLKIREHGFNT
jgi:hypothetical protein